jgi:hypothetical protein
MLTTRDVQAMLGLDHRFAVYDLCDKYRHRHLYAGGSPARPRHHPPPGLLMPTVADATVFRSLVMVDATDGLPALCRLTAVPGQATLRATSTPP